VISGGWLGLLQHQRRKARVRRTGIGAGVAGKPSSPQDSNGGGGGSRSHGGGSFPAFDGGREVREGAGDARVAVCGERKGEACDAMTDGFSKGSVVRGREGKGVWGCLRGGGRRRRGGLARRLAARGGQQRLEAGGRGQCGAATSRGRLNRGGGERADRWATATVSGGCTG
jgi:hypothetical protein